MQKWEILEIWTLFECDIRSSYRIKFVVIKMRTQNVQKNNTRDSNVVPHRSTNRARRCLTSLSRREAVLSSWYGRSWFQSCFTRIHTDNKLSWYLFSSAIFSRFSTIHQFSHFTKCLSVLPYWPILSNTPWHGCCILLFQKHCGWHGIGRNLQLHSSFYPHPKQSPASCTQEFTTFHLMASSILNKLLAHQPSCKNNCN